MVIGTVRTSIILENPNRVHCGPRDPVRGHVKIMYTPGPSNPSDELFGPLKVFVILHGRAKTKLWKSNGQSTNVYRGRAPLFLNKVLVYNDSFKIHSRHTTNIPFSVTFPETVKASAYHNFTENPGFDCDHRQSLPPSFDKSYHGFANRFEAFVEYRLGVEAFMPQLQVNVVTPTKFSEPRIHYERPRLLQPVNPTPCTWRGQVWVSNERLLPASDRPSGFKEKTKAFFIYDYFPRYVFDWVCIAPTNVHVGQPACFEVRITPRENECTAVLVPQVRLRYFHIEIIGHTRVRSDKAIFSCLSSEGKYTVCRLTGIIDNHEPFSKANDNSKFIYTEALGGGPMGSFASSFKTYNISHLYTTTIEFVFELAGEHKKVVKEFATIVHPPLLGDSQPQVAMAGPSSQVPDVQDTEAELPQYEPAPTYEEATGSKEESEQATSSKEESK